MGAAEAVASVKVNVRASKPRALPSVREREERDAPSFPPFTYGGRQVGGAQRRSERTPLLDAFQQHRHRSDVTTSIPCGRGKGGIMKRLVIIVAVAASISLAAVANAAVDLEVCCRLRLGGGRASGRCSRGQTRRRLRQRHALGADQEVLAGRFGGPPRSARPAGVGGGARRVGRRCAGNLYVAAVTFTPATQGVSRWRATGRSCVCLEPVRSVRDA